MDNYTIFTKTAKGLGEALGKTKNLSREQRKILKEIDGKASFDDLVEQLGMDDFKLGEVINKLLADDYIREFGSSAPPGAHPSGETVFDLTSPATIEVANSQLTIGDFFRAMEPPPTQSGGAGIDFGNLGHSEAEIARKTLEQTAAQVDEIRRAIEEEAQRITARTQQQAAEAARREAEAKARQEAELARQQAIAHEQARAKQEAEEQARRAAQEQARKAAEEAERQAARIRAEQEARRLAEETARREAEERARREAEEQARRQAKEQARIKAEQEARAAAEARAREEAAAQARKLAQEQARTKAREAARRAAEELAEREAQAKAKAEAERLAQVRAEEEARLAAEEQARRQAEEAARRAAEEQAQREAEEQARLRAEEEARREAEEKARREAEELAKKEAQERARQEAEEAARLKAEEKARQKAEAKARKEAEAQAKREAREQARREAEEKARQEAERKAQLAAEEKARKEAEAQARHAAKEKARQEAEEAARQKAEAAARLKAEKEAEKAAKEAAKAAIKEAAKGPAGNVAEDAGKTENTAIAAGRAESQAPQRVVDSVDAALPETASSSRGMRITLPFSIGKLVRVGALALVGLSVAGLGLIHLVPFNGRLAQLEQEASAQFGKPVKIDSLNLSLLPQPHWRMQQVSIGADKQIVIPQVNATAAIGSLFTGAMQFNSVELVSPVIDEEGLGWILFGQGQGASWQVTSVNASQVKLRMQQVQVPIFNASAEFNDAGVWRKIALNAAQEKLHVDLARAEDAPRFEFTANDLVLPFGGTLAFDTLNASGTVGRGGLDIGKFSAIVYDGTVSGSATLRWQDGWSLKGNAQARHVAPARLAPGVFQGGTLEGDFSYAMQSVEAARLLASPQARGSFSVNGGALTGVDMASHVMGQAGSGKTVFNELNGDFTFDGGKVKLSRMRLAAGLLSAGGDAAVDSDGKLNGHVAIDLRTASRQAHSAFNIGGTLAEPKFSR